MSEIKPQALSLEAGIFASVTFTDSLRRWLVPIVFLLMDYAAVLVAVWSAALLRVDVLPYFFLVNSFNAIPDVYTYIAIPAMVVLFMHFDGMYVRRLPLWQQTERIFKITIYSMLFLLVVMYLTEEVKQLSRPFIALLSIFTFVYLALGRYVMKKMLLRLGLWQVPVVLVGAGKTAELLMRDFEQDNGLGYRVIGLIEDNCSKLNSVFGKIPVIGTFADAEQAVQQTGVKNVLIAAPGLDREKLVDLIYRLQPHVRRVTFVPDLFGIPVGAMELDTLLNEKIVLLNVRNNLARKSNRIMKRIFDIVMTLTGGLLILPFLLVVALLIYLDSPGPVLFSHKRVGADGSFFGCLKFRTMVTNAQSVLKDYLEENPAAKEEWEKDFKLKSDPRITKLGHFLRRTSLDELPQLLNVLKGDMSLVGPRPIVKEEIGRYEEYISDYYLVRPGITGYWQVNGRNDVSYQERVEMDSWYVRNWSLWLDMVLLMKTMKVIYTKKGAY